jgi:hypothetical protein
MSGKTLWNPDKETDKIDGDLVAEELGFGQTCPATVTGTRRRT